MLTLLLTLLSVEGGNMARRLYLVLASVVLLTSSSCIWWDRDHREYHDYDRDRGGHEEHEGHGEHWEHEERH